MISSISRSQLELNKSSNGDSPSASTTETTGYYSQQSLYTLPRKRPEKILSADPSPPPVFKTLHRSHSAVASPSVCLTVTTPTPAPPPPPPLVPAPPPPPPVAPSVENGERETYSSMHRRKMAARYADPVDIMTPPLSKTAEPAADPLTYQTSTKSTHRSYRGSSSETSRASQSLGGINEEVELPSRNPPPPAAAAAAAKCPPPEVDDAPENKSLKDRIALLESAGILANHVSPSAAATLPRIVSGKSKGPAPPPPPRVSSAIPAAPSPAPEADAPAPVEPASQADQEDDGVKKNIFLKGLLDAAPELFMHIHGDEKLPDVARGPRTPSPLAPPLVATPPSPPQPSSARGVQSFTFPPDSRASNLSRVYTSTPALNQVQMRKQLGNL